MNTYACYNKELDVRIRSSSGGVFSLLAECILSKNGVIYGVAMSEDCYSAEFISVTEKTELWKLRGSKYLQAKLGNTFRNVQSDLNDGKIVLFSGTGCQVNGLKRFLGKDYDNLLCIDVVCHGVPSSALWKRYAEYQESLYKGKMIEVGFRCKDKGWSDFGIEKVMKTSSDDIITVYCSKDEDPFMQMFLRDYCLRPSCYACVAKNEKLADITMADFWGINKVIPEMNDEKGVSLVLTRTDRGRKYFGMIQEGLYIKEVTYQDGVRFNPAEYRSVERPVERHNFFSDMKTLSFEQLAIKYASPIKRSMAGKLKMKIKKLLRVILSWFRKIKK